MDATLRADLLAYLDGLETEDADALAARIRAVSWPQDFEEVPITEDGPGQPAPAADPNLTRASMSGS